MASQGNNPNKGNQKGGLKDGKQKDQDRKGAPSKGVGADSKDQAAGKGRPGKFDSGKQTNR